MSQGISRHCIDPQSQNIPSPGSEEFKLTALALTVLKNYGKCKHIFIFSKINSSEQVNGLVQERRDSIANALELLLSLTNPLKCYPLTPSSSRFHTLPDTWEYTIHITDCVFTPANVSVPSIPCPVLLATRGQALPDMTLHERGEVCRDKGAPCDVVVGQPVADTWHNVALQSNSTGNLTLTFHVETQGKQEEEILCLNIKTVLLSIGIFSMEI